MSLKTFSRAKTGDVEPLLRAGPNLKIKVEDDDYSDYSYETESEDEDLEERSDRVNDLRKIISNLSIARELCSGTSKAIR